MKPAILIALLLTSSAAFAAPKPEPAGRKGSEIVCRVNAETGSRLSRERVCLTRDQWSEQKRLQRQTVEKGQSMRPLNGE